jgi:hypothetical protein
MGCGSPNSFDDESAGTSGGATRKPTRGGLRFEEIFYAGSPGVVEHTFNDQFYDIRNDSDGTHFADGLIIGDAYGAAGEVNPGQPKSPFQGDLDFVYLANAFRIPGSGQDHPLLPGDTLTVVQDGTNHQPDSVLDHGGADYEAFIGSSGKDDDWPTVPNLEALHFTGGYDWLVPVFGGSMVLARVDDPATLELVEHPVYPQLGPVLRLPVTAILDGVEALMDAESVAYKRLPPSVDAGFAFVSETYTGESIRRRRMHDGPEGLQDTNDSSKDFEVLSTPAPGE